MLDTSLLPVAIANLKAQVCFQLGWGATYGFETVVTSTYGQRVNACQRVKVLLEAKNAISIVHLINSGV
ncbi:hypothetical protein [Spirosoma endophyticum]|uniref:hypothetical protein n=1 Tax=Spirosoma endophyticum TaxID=662367 RepID=UPI000B84F0FB|nr:hypothetical protein [Spirosoma endophyticum]